MKYEKSCGAVIIKENNILLIEQKSGFYGFPKGHMEEFESEKETAIREVKEETNLDIEILSDLSFPLSYLQKSDMTKEVVYFLARPINEEVRIQESELSGYEWVNIDEVGNKLTFDNMKEIWKLIKEEIKKIMS